MKNQNSPFQQCDVLCFPVKELPAGLKSKKSGKRGHVLAEGEASGHAHTIAADDGIYLFQGDDGMLWT